MESQDLEALLPWVLTGVIEIIAALQGSEGLREIAHRRLGLSRLRYGVPHQDLCELAREHDRVVLAQLTDDFSELSRGQRLFTPLRDFAERRLVQLSQDHEEQSEDEDNSEPDPP